MPTYKCPCGPNGAQIKTYGDVSIQISGKAASISCMCGKDSREWVCIDDQNNDSEEIIISNCNIDSCE